MDLRTEVKNIELVSSRDKDWYYYGIHNDVDSRDILEKGIKCHALNKKSKNNMDSKYYISLCKDRMNGNVSDLYRTFLKYDPMFVIDSSASAIKCSDNPKYELFENTIIPLRYSCCLDEYHAFLKIAPEKIIGIECALLGWSNGPVNEFAQRLEKVKNILIYTKELGIDLPFYDNYGDFENKNFKIDKEGIMYLSRKLK